MLMGVLLVWSFKSMYICTSKHVYVVLLALQMFIESGDLITEETCTQILQTFDHVKPYKGSPIKA